MYRFEPSTQTGEMICAGAVSSSSQLPPLATISNQSFGIEQNSLFQNKVKGAVHSLNAQGDDGVANHSYRPPGASDSMLRDARPPHSHRPPAKNAAGPESSVVFE